MLALYVKYVKVSHPAGYGEVHQITHKSDIWLDNELKLVGIVGYIVFSMKINKNPGMHMYTTSSRSQL